jgi:hypothetical protein
LVKRRPRRLSRVIQLAPDDTLDEAVALVFNLSRLGESNLSFAIDYAFLRSRGLVAARRHHRRRTASFIGTRFGAGRVRSKSQNQYQENPLAKPNYRHAKKQKEAARKARQDAKQQRRSQVPETSDAPAMPAAPVPAKSVE